MATPKVDEIHLHFSKTTGMLRVWLFNDDSKYEAKCLGRIARYDFGRKPDEENGNPADHKMKLDKGLYREPYRDGWKYTINSKLHPAICYKINQYADYGKKTNEDGAKEEFTYLRHNRKAFGIYNLLERYMVIKWYCENALTLTTSVPVDYRYCSADWSSRPYFPASVESLKEFRHYYEECFEYIKAH